jgi:hypothetical protein
MKTPRLLLALLLAAAPLPVAFAKLIAYEPFDYETGPLVGQGGGIGWNSKWQLMDGLDFTVESLLPPAYTGSVAHPPSGRYVSLVANANYTKVVRDLAKTAQGDVWISWIYRPNGVTGDGNYSGIEIFGDNKLVAYVGDMGDGQSSNLTLSNDAGRSTSGPILDGVAQLVTVHVTNLGVPGASSVHVYVGDDFTGPALSFTNQTLVSVDQIRLIVGGGGANGVAFDEIWVGTSKSDVVLAP